MDGRDKQINTWKDRQTDINIQSKATKTDKRVATNRHICKQINRKTGRERLLISQQRRMMESRNTETDIKLYRQMHKIRQTDTTDKQPNNNSPAKCTSFLLITPSKTRKHHRDLFRKQTPKIRDNQSSPSVIKLFTYVFFPSSHTALLQITEASRSFARLCTGDGK